MCARRIAAVPLFDRSSIAFVHAGELAASAAKFE
jgi:hypothetical protein